VWGESKREVRPRPPTLAWVKAQAKVKKKEIVQEWWTASVPESYKRLGLGPYLDAQGLSRKDMSRLVAHRIGHGRFASYFKRFNIVAEDPECKCGATIEPVHRYNAHGGEK
jgi:hypothetical protein